MSNRNLLQRATKLASLATVSAGALSLTAGKAHADVILSATLNTLVGFSSNSNPTRGVHNVATHVFNTFASGPNFSFKARSIGSSGTNYRSVLGFGATFMIKGDAIGTFAKSSVWNPLGTYGNGFAVAARSFGSGDFGDSRSGFTDEYFLFRFSSSGATEYGWIEASLSITRASNSLASNGPNLTVVQYAWDNSGAEIKAGDMGTSASPEPASLAETGVGALILGAEGLRRWRKACQRT